MPVFFIVFASMHRVPFSHAVQVIFCSLSLVANACVCLVSFVEHLDMQAHGLLFQISCEPSSESQELHVSEQELCKLCGIVVAC